MELPLMANLSQKQATLKMEIMRNGITPHRGDPQEVYFCGAAFTLSSPYPIFLVLHIDVWLIYA